MRRFGQVVVGVLTLFTSPVEGASLRGFVRLNADVIKLGDLFTEVDQDHNLIVGPAPSPGQKITLSTERVKSIAQQYQIDWTPRGQEVAVIERQGTLLSKDHFVAVLEKAIREKTERPSIHFEITSILPPLMVSEGETVQISLEKLTVDDRQNRFQAVIQIHDQGAKLKQIQVVGTLSYKVSVPVLNKPLPSGAMISESDVEMLEVNSTRIRNNTIRSRERLVGYTVQAKDASPHTPLNGNDVTLPWLVKQGSLVTMVVKTKNLMVTSRGKVMENGRKGDAVRVMNLESKKIILGNVETSSVVRVDSPFGDVL